MRNKPTLLLGFAGSKRVHADNPQASCPLGILEKLRHRELGGTSAADFSSESFHHIDLLEEYDAFGCAENEPTRLPSLLDRSRVVDLVSEDGVIFCLSCSGTCSAFCRRSNKRLCFLNTSQEEVIRTIFHNEKRKALITVSVKTVQGISSLHCRSTSISSIKAGQPENSTFLLSNIAFQYPGFLELDDLNDRMLTYSAIDRLYKIYSLEDHQLVHEFSSIGITDVKLSPGILLLVMQPQGNCLPMRVHSMHDPTISFDVELEIVAGTEILFLVQLNEKVLLKQAGRPLRICDIFTGQVKEVYEEEIQSPDAFVFMHQSQLFLTFNEGRASCWNAQCEQLSSFKPVDGHLPLEASGTGCINVTSKQDLLITYYKVKPESQPSGMAASPEDMPQQAGCIIIRRISDGSEVACVKAQPSRNKQTVEALADVTALVYDEKTREIYTGSKRGMVHVWGS